MVPRLRKTIGLALAGLFLLGLVSVAAVQDKDKPTDKPTDKVTDKPTDKVTDKPTDKVTDKPTDKVTDKDGGKKEDKAPPDRAVLKVRVIPDAKLTIDGAATTPTGANRRFVSDVMKSGAQFEYELKATWTDLGEKKWATKKIMVRPGMIYEVDLTTPDKAPKPDVKPDVKPDTKPDVKPDTKPDTKPDDGKKKEGAAKLVKEGQDALKTAKTKDDFDKIIKMADDALKLDPTNKDADALKKEATDKKPKEEAKARTFRFTYAVTITGLPTDKAARVWVPLAHSSDEQTVEVISRALPQGRGGDRI
jgi:uncharacterized protein (TIGR03000 family)